MNETARKPKEAWPVIGSAVTCSQVPPSASFLFMHIALHQ